MTRLTRDETTSLEGSRAGGAANGAVIAMHGITKVYDIGKVFATWMQ